MSQKLTTKQKLFVEFYLGAAHCNATEAARMAGYRGNDATLAAVGSENLRKPHISALISQRVQEIAMTADEVLRRLTDIGRGTLEDFFDLPEGQTKPVLNLNKAAARGQMHLLKVVRLNDAGDLRSIELHNPQVALDRLARHHRLLDTKRPEDELPDMDPAEAGALLMGLMGKALERFDKALANGTLPQGVPIPRTLLLDGFEPPEGMIIRENTPVVIEVEPEPSGLSDDEILDALQQGGEAQSD